MEQFFTFGSEHEHHGNNLDRKYVRVEAVDETVARQLMLAVYGNDWCAQYTPGEFARIKTKYGLQEYASIIERRTDAEPRA